MLNKVLVTGGTGFLGAYIIKELIEKGYPVRAIRRSPKLPGFIPADILNKAEWVDGDVLDVLSLEDAMEGIDAVIHSAAVVSFIKKERKKMYQVNVEGTANVVNIALEKNVKKLVHISSVAAIGRTTGGDSINEEKRWDEKGVNTHYGRSKNKAELEIWRGVSEGLDAVILNPSTIIGFGDWNNSSCAIFKTVFKGFNWYPPGINGFVAVEDMARVAVMFLENNITEQRFIINAENWRFKKLQDAIAGGFGKKRPKWKTTPFLIGLVWRWEKLKSILTGQKPLLTREISQLVHRDNYFENAKILGALPGFSFTPVEETIQKACEKYQGASSPVQL